MVDHISHNYKPDILIHELYFWSPLNGRNVARSFVCCQSFFEFIWATVPWFLENTIHLELFTIPCFYNLYAFSWWERFDKNILFRSEFAMIQALSVLYILPSCESCIKYQLLQEETSVLRAEWCLFYGHSFIRSAKTLCEYIQRIFYSIIKKIAHFLRSFAPLYSLTFMCFLKH